VQETSYSPFALLRLLGVSSPSARVVVTALTLAALGGILLVARGRDGDRRSFVLALATGFVASPIVWMHYLVVVFVPLGLYRPRLGAAWLIPLAYWGLQTQENQGSAAKIVVMFALTGLAVALAMWQRREQAPVPALSSP
jgi:hypothetical protein